MGLGMVMNLPPKDLHLKATASPAAREIQYSKVGRKKKQGCSRVPELSSPG